MLHSLANFSQCALELPLNEISVTLLVTINNTMSFPCIDHIMCISCCGMWTQIVDYHWLVYCWLSHKEVPTNLRLVLVFTFSTFLKFAWYTFLSPFGLVCEKTSSWNLYRQAPLLVTTPSCQLFSSLKLDGKSETFWGLIWPCFERQSKLFAGKPCF